MAYTGAKPTLCPHPAEVAGDRQAEVDAMRFQQSLDLT
jgi:hypothetical protein